MTRAVLLESVTKVEFTVWAVRPDGSLYRTKGVFLKIGQAIAVAADYADRHPDEVVTVLAQRVTREQFQSAKVSW